MLRFRSFRLRWLVPCTAALAGGAARAESFADAVALAYAHNPSLVQQRYAQRAIDENYVQARSQYGPTFSVQATGGYNYQAVGSQADSTNTGQQVSANFSQPLYSGGQLRGQLLAARANVSAGRENLRQTEQQVLQNVVAVYAAVLRDEQRLEVARQNIIVLQDQLLENRERYSRVGRGQGAGDVTLTDVGQADSRVAAAQATLASVEADLATSRGQYLQIVGRNPGTLEPLPDFPSLPASIDEAFQQAEENNPGLLSAKYTEQASSATAAGARGALGPTIALTGQGVYQNQIYPGAGRLHQKSVIAGLSITQPLFDGGLRRSRARQAAAQNGADQAGVDVARRSAVEQVTSAWSQLAAARTSLVAGQRQVSSAQLAFAGMHREELNGLRSTIETLNAEQELVSAQLALLQNRYTEALARAQLLAAVGNLSASALVPTLDVYDPEANFRRVRNRGQTPLEPLARAIDRIGSANPRRPLIADLQGPESPLPDATQPMPPPPGPELTRKPLVPVTESPLVPASSLPGGLPPAPDLPSKLAMPAGDRP